MDPRQSTFVLTAINEHDLHVSDPIKHDYCTIWYVIPKYVDVDNVRKVVGKEIVDYVKGVSKLTGDRKYIAVVVEPQYEDDEIDVGIYLCYVVDLETNYVINQFPIIITSTDAKLIKLI